MNDRERLILLNTACDIGTIRTRRLIEAFGSLKALFEAPEAKLRQVDGIGSVLSKRLYESCRNLKALNKELQLAGRFGVSIVSQLDLDFPKPLLQIPDPPLVLYQKGKWRQEDNIAVGIVGARRASLYGGQMAERLSYDLAIRGVTIVSGLARGIDASAHRGALKAGGRTLAVLGNGLSSIYPPEHTELANEIALHGAYFSEYPMCMAALAGNFPRRNRIVSGLSLGVVIVEAAKKSGALITADCALEQGREVFAIPGKIDSITSFGTNELLKQGAKLITCVDDIIEELRLKPCTYCNAKEAGGPAKLIGLSREERKILDGLSSDEPIELDKISAMCDIPVASCVATLLGLELKHLAKQLPGKRFVKTQ